MRIKENSHDSFFHNNGSIKGNEYYLKSHSNIYDNPLNHNNNKRKLPLSSSNNTINKSNLYSKRESSKINKNDHSFIDLYDASQIYTSLSSIISPNIINYNLKRGKKDKIKRKDKGSKKNKKYGKTKMNVADDFDNILNKIEQVVLKDNQSETKNNSYILNTNKQQSQHHHHHHRHHYNNSDENLGEERLLLKVKEALISNSNELNNGMASNGYKQMPNNDKNNKNNDNNNNGKDYTRILLDSISEIPSFDDKKSTIIENEKKLTLKYNLYQNIEQQNDCDEKKSIISSPIFKNNFIDKKYQTNEKIQIENNNNNDDNINNNDDNDDMKFFKKEKIPSPSHIANSKQNNYNNEKLQEYLLYENKILKKRLYELENSCEFSHICTKKMNENQITDNNTIDNNHVNEKNINDKKISSNMFYDIFPLHSVHNEKNNQNHFNPKHMKLLYHKTKTNINDSNNKRKTENNNDFNNIQQSEIIFEKEKYTKSFLNSYKNENDIYPNDKENNNSYSMNIYPNLELSSTNVANKKNYNFDNSLINEQNLLSQNSFSMNNIPKIEYNNSIDDTDETMFDKLYVPIIKKYIKPTRSFHDKKNYNYNKNNKMTTVTSSNNTITSNTKNQPNFSCFNDLLNNSINYSYSNFSFDSKQYLMNHGLIDKR